MMKWEKLINSCAGHLPAHKTNMMIVIRAVTWYVGSGSEYFLDQGSDQNWNQEANFWFEKT